MATVALGPAQVDLTGVRAGDQNAIQLTISSKGKAYDLTGKVVTAQARLTPLATEALDAVVTVTAPTQGKVTVSWPGAAVATLLANKETWTGVWDLQVAAAGEDAITLVAGTFAAVMDVTRAP